MIRFKTLKSTGAQFCVYPTQTTGVYGGPIFLNESNVTEEISFRSSYDSLDGRPGIHGENHVNHRELNAVLSPNYKSDIRMRSSWIFRGITAQGKVDRSSIVINSPLISPSNYVRGTEVVLDHGPRSSTTVVLSSRLRNPDLSYYYQNAMVTLMTVDSVAEDGSEIRCTRRRYRIPLSLISLGSETDAEKVRAAREYARLVDEKYLYQTTPIVTRLYLSDLKLTYSNPVSAKDAYEEVSHLPYFKYPFPDDVKSPGDLVQSAIEMLDSNTINMFELLQGLKRPWELVPKLRNLSQLKTHAGNYLGLQYGILPTIDDLKKLSDLVLNGSSDYFDTNNFKVVSSGHSTSRSSSLGLVTVVDRLKIAVNPSNPRLNSLSERLRDIGFFPSIDNLWELLPYSFVIDWFINVGDMLENFDAGQRAARLPIVYSTSSRKITVIPELPKSLMDKGIAGTVEIIHYSRSVSASAPRPTLNFEVSNELPNHWLEAGALIITAKK